MSSDPDSLITAGASDRTGNTSAVKKTILKIIKQKKTSQRQQVYKTSPVKPTGSHAQLASWYLSQHAQVWVSGTDAV